MPFVKGAGLLVTGRESKEALGETVMKQREWSSGVRLYLPPRNISLDFARGVGRSLALIPKFRPWIESRSMAGEYVCDILDLMLPRPGMDINQLPARHKGLSAALEEIGDHFFEGGQESLKGAIQRVEPLKFRYVGKAPDRNQGVSGGGLQFPVDDYEVRLQPIHPEQPRTGGSWDARVTQQGTNTVAFVQVRISLNFPYVGPLIVDWDGPSPAEGLDVILQLLRSEFGASPGIAVSEWKVIRAKPAHISDCGIIGELISGELRPRYARYRAGFRNSLGLPYSTYTSFETKLFQHIDLLQSELASIMSQANALSPENN